MTIKIINKFTNKLKNAESEAEAFRAKHLLQYTGLHLIQ